MRVFACLFVFVFGCFVCVCVNQNRLYCYQNPKVLRSTHKIVQQTMICVCVCVCVRACVRACVRVCE